MNLVPVVLTHAYSGSGAGGESARDPGDSAAPRDSSEAEGEAL